MTQQELDTIIDRHKHWLKKDCEGWEEMRANLKGANLKGANLEGASFAYSEKHRLGQILKDSITGYKKNSRGCSNHCGDSCRCNRVLHQREEVPHEQGEDYGYGRQ